MKNKTSSNMLLKKFSGIWGRNVIISMGLGLVPAVAASGSLKQATIMSIVMTMVLLPTYIFAAALKIKKPQYIRYPIYALISAVFFIPAIITVTAIFGFSPNDPFMLYLYLVVVDVIIIERADSFARYNKISTAIIDGVVNIAGFTVVTVVIAVLREFFGAGTIWDVKLFKNPASAIRMPMFGFIAIGVFAAFVNAVDNFFEKKETRKNTEENINTENETLSFKKEEK